eukprot:TRINITY_DN2059_c0_g1_i4.p1 TRINITY_DN2059_c0_g1~~TRINITY_DN2059_c0_g1_i4.p1  ORF type:complete len:215 (-),score=14.43 TRINITY_DN2059_c0_g1_i4:35-679(-)
MCIRDRPKMGESVAEATLTNWLKEVGDTIEADEAVLEIATDKVDSEVPSEVDGVLVEKLFNVDDVVQVGQTIAIIETEGGSNESEKSTSESTSSPSPEVVKEVEKQVETAKQATQAPIENTGDRFYSPLVKNIAAAEGISQTELDGISGTGKDGRVTKNDILGYVENRSSAKPQASVCLLYTSDAADDLLCVDLGGRRILKKKKHNKINKPLRK